MGSGVSTTKQVDPGVKSRNRTVNAINEGERTVSQVRISNKTVIESSHSHNNMLNSSGLAEEQQQLKQLKPSSLLPTAASSLVGTSAPGGRAGKDRDRHL